MARYVALLARSRVGVIGAGYLSAILAAGAVAAADTYPKIDVQIPIEIQNDWSYRSDDGANRRNDLTTDTEPEVTLTFAPGFKLFVQSVIEAVHDPAPGKDRYFGDFGLFLETVYLEYDHDRFFVRGGKFTPDFGLAWDAAPGIYGTDFAEAGYEFSERIALAAGVKLGDDALGRHTVSASTFFRDTSALAGSVITSRGRLRPSDGGVGNTGDFSSFAIALTGEKIPAVPPLRYHLAYVHQRAGAGGTSDEDGVAIGLTGKVKPWAELKGWDEVALSPLVEYVHFSGADGVDGQERDFLTLSILAEWRRWNLALSFTGRTTQTQDGTDTTDALFQVSAGYKFDFGLSVDLGWRIANEDHIETQTVGLLLAYTLAF